MMLVKQASQQAKAAAIAIYNSKEKRKSFQAKSKRNTQDL
jgi:hypothetical protein